jgi:hypothetical protein
MTVVSNACDAAKWRRQRPSENKPPLAALIPILQAKACDLRRCDSKQWKEPSQDGLDGNALRTSRIFLNGVPFWAMLGNTLGCAAVENQERAAHLPFHLGLERPRSPIFSRLKR